MSNSINCQNQRIPAYSGITINITSPTLYAPPAVNTPACNAEGKYNENYGYYYGENIQKNSDVKSSSEQFGTQNVSELRTETVKEKEILKETVTENNGYVTNPQTAYYVDSKMTEEKSAKEAYPDSYPAEYYINNYNVKPEDEKKAESYIKTEKETVYIEREKKDDSEVAGVSETSALKDLSGAKDIDKENRYVGNADSRYGTAEAASDTNNGVMTDKTFYTEKIYSSAADVNGLGDNSEQDSVKQYQADKDSAEKSAYVYNINGDSPLSGAEPSEQSGQAKQVGQAGQTEQTNQLGQTGQSEQPEQMQQNQQSEQLAQDNQDLSTSQEIITELDARNAEEKSLEKNGKKVRVVALTNEYIMSLENYLNNPNTDIRLMAAKDILTRLDEDRERYDDAALNALLNKMLQDPAKLVRVAALSALAADLASGNDYTVELLNRIQQNPNADQQDVLDAAQILLNRSAATEVRYIPVQENSNE